MGTNYYLQWPARRCDSCGNTGESPRIHIGKTSVGWHFGFEATKYKTADEWKRAIDECVATGGWISNEYEPDIPIQPAEFWAKVEARRTLSNCQAKYSSRWSKTVCVDGVDFSDHEFS